MRRTTIEYLMGKLPEIMTWREEGLSVDRVCERLQCSRPVLRAFLKEQGITLERLPSGRRVGQTGRGYAKRKPAARREVSLAFREKPIPTSDRERLRPTRRWEDLGEGEKEKLLTMIREYRSPEERARRKVGGGTWI